MAAAGASPNLYALNLSMLNRVTDISGNQTAAEAYFTYAKYLIAAEAETFLENTISSTYVLLNASNYDALAATYKRQTDVTSSEVGLMRRTHARVEDTRSAAEWDGADYGAKSTALATFALGVPVAGIAYDQGSVAGAAGAVAVTTVVAMVAYAIATARTHRDVSKIYWAPPPKETGSAV